MAAALSSRLSLPLTFSTGFHCISTVLLWLLLMACVDAQNQSTAEVQTLLRFKQMTEDVDSDPLTIGYWNTWKEADKTPCAWYGIVCTDRSTVESVDLSVWGLTQLPSVGVLANLTDLRKLILWGNKWGQEGTTVSIPDDIGTLVGLTFLDLSKNNFSGPIPPSISACRGLRFLSLETNSLTGEIPDLSGLVNLQYLRLQNNQLRGPFPTWLGGLDTPLEIFLSFNMLSGPIPSLSHLTNLLDLALDNNSFTGFDGAFFPNAKSLEQLSVKFNQLQGPIPPNITKLLNLKVLDLSGNQLSGYIPPGFSINMSDSTRIDLSYNQLIGSIPESLLQSTATTANLPSLKISHNLLTGHIPFDGTKQYNYEAIDFNHNNLTGPIPSICKNGTSVINDLSLQNNQLSGDIIEFLADCYAQIQDLELANNSFTGDLSKLATVNTSLDLVMRESNLQTVDLSNNNLHISTSEANPDPLRVILEFFVLDTSVIQFRMQGNNFSGASLPAYFSSSANSLQVLDLSNNHLQGEISGAAFNDTWLPALQFLNLSNNDLSGPLPAQLPDRLYNPSFFVGNSRLCGGPFIPSCSQRKGLRWWIFLIVFGGLITTIVASCLVVTWRWRVYRKMHQQDEDLIRTLLERESATLMPLRELKKATNNFAESAQIGEGGFGTVYRGQLSDGTIVAIKRSKREGSENDKEKFLNEVRILSQVNHRHLVKLLGCCMENRIALLVFEFVPNGTLQEHLRGSIEKTSLSWKRRLHIAVQTADALNYLHSAAAFPIYHRDVKSSNILLDHDLDAKVADFGISKLAPLEATHVSTIAIQGTIGYMDPEYYTSYQLTDKSDVYSFGVVLLELISAKPAVDFVRGEEKTSLVNFASIHMQNGDLNHFIDKALKDTYNNLAGHGRESILRVARLAMKCVQMRSKARPCMYEVWKELRDMDFELEDISKDTGSIADGGNNQDILSDSQDDDTILLSSDSSWSQSNSRSKSSSFSLNNDATSIQLSQFSQFKRGRSQSS